MKALCVLALTVLSISTSAQKIVSNKTDKFDNSTIIKTSSEPLEKNLGVAQTTVTGYIYKKDLKVVNALSFIFRYYLPTGLKKPNSVVLIFTDGSKMVLEFAGSLETYDAQKDINFNVEPTLDQLKKISEMEVTDIRFETIKGNKDIEIRSKLRSSLKGIAKLLLDNQ